MIDFVTLNKEFGFSDDETDIPNASFRFFNGRFDYVWGYLDDFCLLGSSKLNPFIDRRYFKQFPSPLPMIISLESGSS
jgi:hypothetical protein